MSHVSVAADRTPTSKRRNATTGLKNSGLDFAAYPVSSVGGKDPKRSFKLREETVPEGSIGPPKIKGHIPTDAGATLPRRTTAKKADASSSSSSSKPLWKTVLKVLTKNFVLLLVMVLLAQMVRKLAFNQWDGNDALLLSSDYETVMAEMEAYLKTTTKTMQIRVDAVDQKLQNKINDLKTEIRNRIDCNLAESSLRFEKLDERVKSMEKSERLSREEFDGYTSEFKNPKPFDNLGNIKLDEIRAFARDMVDKELEKHAADGLGRVDYASASGGAMVVNHSDPFSKKGNWFNRNKVSSEAVKMIQPSFGEPGQCFSLKGNTGFVEVKLRTAIIPQAITLEHVAKSVAFDRSTAPKECRVFGWLHKDMGERHMLTEFVYDLEKSTTQTYNVVDMGGSSTIDTIRLEFMSNHGNPTLTCVYRLRVHGQEPLSSIAL